MRGPTRWIDDQLGSIVHYADQGRSLARKADRRFEQGKRLTYCAGGAGMVLAGVRRNTLPGLAVALVGCDLVYRGVTGSSPFARRSRNASRQRPGYGYGVKVHDSLVIHRPAEQLYRFCRDPMNLLGLMDRIVSVEPMGSHARWKMKTGVGRTVEWDAEVIADRKNELIGWRTIGRGAIDHAGSIRFEPMFDGQSTHVSVALQYSPRLGAAGNSVARLFGMDLGSWIQEEFHRFKRFAESTDLPMLESFVAGVRNRH